MVLAGSSYGASDRPPRGDYSRARPDYSCEQNYAAYTEQDHAIYRRLFERQASLLPRYASKEILRALPMLGASERIPRFEEINERLIRATGWEIVGVPGLIPEAPFFSLLANRKFPVTDWIRTPAELDYIVEPDVFHDLFGHVPLLFNADYADYVQRYGAGGLKAQRLDACEQLSRLYWYTIEFGLIAEADGLRAYGAGLLSSSGELAHSTTDPAALRIKLDLLRTMRTRYKIDSYQAIYFVIDGFKQLFDMTAPDFSGLYRQLGELDDIAAGDRVPEDRPVALQPQAAAATNGPEAS